MRKKRAKIRDIKRHAKQRALQRFNIILNDDDIRDICFLIQKGKAEFIDRQSNRVTRWKVFVKSVYMIVVYDNNRGTIITFLTEEMINNNLQS
jgi:hypothetical protein